MESIKQYLPWIIGAVVVLYVLKKATTRTGFAPQTQLTQTPQPDAYAEARSKAFDTLASLGIAQTKAETQNDLEKFRIASTERVNLSALNLQERLAQLTSLQRYQDNQVQQGAIDRYYSSRNTQTILSSVNQALGSIFGNRGGRNIFGTPPTFPTTTSFGGF